jgi:hypothetical protein
MDHYKNLWLKMKSKRDGPGSGVVSVPPVDDVTRDDEEVEEDAGYKFFSIKKYFCCLGVNLTTAAFLYNFNTGVVVGCSVFVECRRQLNLFNFLRHYITIRILLIRSFTVALQNNSIQHKKTLRLGSLSLKMQLIGY